MELNAELLSAGTPVDRFINPGDPQGLRRRTQVRDLGVVIR